MSREKILITTSWISTIGNAILSVSKIIIGLFAGSLAVVGDGIDSATDVVISIVMIFTARLINRPPSKKYVFGYEKAEGIATKILSLVIFYAGVQMLLSSTKNIFSDEVKEIPSAIAIYVTIFSIIGKLLLASYQYKQGKKINSSMLTANAINMRNDVVISTSVLLGLIFTFIFKLPILDSITGLIISLFIIKSSISIFIDSNVELMYGVKDVNVYNKIFEAVEKVPGASNPHRVRSRMIGNLYMITLDIEVNPQITITQAHEIADAVEKSIINSVDNVYDILVHVEPKKLGFASSDDEKQNYERMKNSVMEEVRRIFKPEFLNRIDETIVFRSLNKNDMKQIVTLMLKDLTDRCKSQMDITLHVRDSVKNYIVEKAYEPKYGARPLRRKIQNEIEDQLAEEILDGKVKKGDEVIVTTKKNAVVFEVKEQ